MKLESMNDLYLHSLKDMHNAEKQLTKALPKLAKGSDSDELRTAFQEHLEETKVHVERLERIIASLDKKTGGVVCHAMKGLVEEGGEILEAQGDPEVLDAGLIQAAQKVEHYEIASYGCLREFAKLLGRKQDVKLLEASLEEEKAADVKLTELAMGMVNRAALN
ncbi:MAG: ferritin-like domain-containing protein [Pyrinomonadaceae bacterium]|nr:ferritin-like domain-containing protein [Phycisphaerales bacterium]